MQSNAPAGIELIKAFASVNPVSLFDMDFDEIFYELDTRNINITKKIEIFSEKFNQAKWTDTMYKFQIYTNEDKGKGLKEEEGKFMPKPIRSGGSVESSDTTKQKKRQSPGKTSQELLKILNIIMPEVLYSEFRKLEYKSLF
ncbi:hypothetical protein HZA55_05115 [Candidatus Poribacteria bacterium]|nr:hypothetical protein [Candidatus Poribacteria bacterium]